MVFCIVASFNFFCFFAFQNKILLRLNRSFSSLLCFFQSVGQNPAIDCCTSGQLVLWRFRSRSCLKNKIEGFHKLTEECHDPSGTTTFLFPPTPNKLQLTQTTLCPPNK